MLFSVKCFFLGVFAKINIKKDQNRKRIIKNLERDGHEVHQSIPGRAARSTNQDLSRIFGVTKNVVS